MNRVLIGLISSLIMVCALSAKAEPTDSVGIVDYQKLGQSISFQDLFKSKMEAALGTSRQDIETLTKAMQEKQKSLDDKTAKLTADQKKALTAALEEMRKKLTAMQADSQKKMMDVRTSIGNELKQKLEQVTGQVAAKHNLSLVFINSSLAYATNKVDITDELITELAKALNLKVNANPAQPQMPVGKPTMMRPNMMQKGASTN